MPKILGGYKIDDEIPTFWTEKELEEYRRKIAKEAEKLKKDIPKTKQK